MSWILIILILFRDSHQTIFIDEECYFLVVLRPDFLHPFSTKGKHTFFFLKLFASSTPSLAAGAKSPSLKAQNFITRDVRTQEYFLSAILKFLARI